MKNSNHSTGDAPSGMPKDSPTESPPPVAAKLLLLLIRLYQITLAPFLGGHCRYEPTCSHYAIEAIQEHGPWRGALLALKRLLRCHPFVKGGYDPVPPRASEGGAGQETSNEQRATSNRTGDE